MRTDRLLAFTATTWLGAMAPAVTLAAPACGNGVAEPGEACDGSDLRGYDCATVAAGFVSGELACEADWSVTDLRESGG